MLESVAQSFKELADHIKDIKEFVPDILKDGKPLEIGAENINEPVERKSKGGFTEYQRELLLDEYGLSDEEIGQYANWEDFENKYLNGIDDIHDVTSGTQHSGKIYNEGELVKKDGKDDYTKYDGEVIKQDREVKTSHPLIVDSTDDVAYLKEPIESKNFPKGPEAYRDLDKESVLKKDSWKEQDTNSLISNKLKDTPENSDSKKDNEAESEGFQYPEDSMLAVFNKKDTVEDNDSDINVDDAKEELTVEQKQEIADKAAQEYNNTYKPYEQAVKKGIEGVKETENGGVSFAETDYVYEKEDGTKCIVKIEATGNRQKDFDVANEAVGLDETPEGYVWHHVDDYNVEDGTITLELVEDEAHNASKPHAGGCAQYDAVNGPSYNPPKKGE